MVRAKFVVISIEDGTVKLHAVTGGSPENDTFFNATPMGEISVGIVNEEALKQFEVGKEVYIDFTPA